MKLLVVGMLLSVACPVLGNWPQFRGPSGDGIYPPREDGKPHGFPVEWSEQKHVAWKTPVPGRAWSTPVVMGDQVWLTNATEDGRKMYAVCLDKESGRKLHDLLLFENADPEPLSNAVNGYGSCSPAIDEERVYIHFGSYGTAALDRETGEVAWQRRDLPCRHFRGPGSSVVLYQDTIILTMDGIDVQYVVALDRETGKTVWKTDRSADFGDVESDGTIRGGGDFRKAYSTPGLVEVGGKVQLVSMGAKAAYGYDAATGEERWKVTHDGYSAAATPVFIGHRMAVLNTGFGKAHLLGVRLEPGMKGDVTRSHVEWDVIKRIPKLSSPTVVEGRIYVASELGVLSRIDPATGGIEDAIPLRAKFTASGAYADGHLYFLGEEGEGIVVQPGEEMKVVARNSLDDGFMASPAFDGDSLYLRTRSHVYRIQAPTK
ncbi:PQQ-binding-like beta-propeller repeat protein [Haloferula sp. A504]|uniref:outer membrane protein assembly factor BamB family protein n=1 Tax=Haloferula sp. A504 TaxID=3373601 RepID=UPI0031BD813A|nr:PQQ-binding-like beta-propeller repeat protein [Verrucomicrobiaceae bacterium E54]